MISKALFYGGSMSTGVSPPKPSRGRDKPLPDGWRVKKRRDGKFVVQQSKAGGMFWKTHSYLISDWLSGGISINYTFSTWEDAVRHADQMA